MSTPHQLMVEAILTVQLKPLDDAIASAEVALADCRHLALEMNRKVGGYEQLIAALIIKRKQLVEEMIQAATL